MNHDKTIYFFGYGAYRDPEKIKKILGRLPGTPIGAIVEGFSLYYQNLNQIPEPAKKILKDVWGDNFKAYTLNPSKGEVAGQLWKITPTELEIIKEWEFVGIWREIIEIKVKTFNNVVTNALTEKATNSQLHEGFYDGINYPNNLNINSNIITDMERSIKDTYRTERIKSLRLELKKI